GGRAGGLDLSGHATPVTSGLDRRRKRPARASPSADECASDTPGRPSRTRPVTPYARSVIAPAPASAAPEPRELTADVLRAHLERRRYPGRVHGRIGDAGSRPGSAESARRSELVRGGALGGHCSPCVAGFAAGARGGTGNRRRGASSPSPGPVAARGAGVVLAELTGRCTSGTSA